MYARITQLRVLPGKLHDYLEAVDTLRPMMRKQAGFRAILLLRSAETPAKDGDDREIVVTAVSVWETHEHLRASEKICFSTRPLLGRRRSAKGSRRSAKKK